MSVYTKVEIDELETFLQRYSIGNLINHAGISAGVTNTNYWLETDRGSYVLTLFEHVDGSSLDYTLGLQHHLANRGVSCGAPVVDNLNSLYSPLNGRPAAIVGRVPGFVCSNPSIDKCHQIGTELARFHIAGLDFKCRRSNSRDLDWWLSVVEKLRFVLVASDLELIRKVIEEYQSFDLAKLPKGALHGDLFHDNTLFKNDCLGGIIDFDYACHDYFVYDIAITINDWCIDAEGKLEPKKLSAFLTAYSEIRLLQECEHAAMPIMLQVAALRFWLSRLYDKTFPLEGELTFVKDPNEFRRMLLLRRDKSKLLADTKTGKYGAE